MPKGFDEEERVRIAARLIEAGRRSLNRAGMRGLVVGELARAAGIAKGSFYSFFPSKEEFILAVFESWEEEYRGALLAALAEGPGEPRARLEAFFRGAFALLEREPALATLGSAELALLMERIPPARLAAHAERDGKALREAARAWEAAGLAGPLEPAALEGAMRAIFLVALHRADFPEGSWPATVALLSEALALRLAAPPSRASPSPARATLKRADRPAAGGKR